MRRELCGNKAARRDFRNNLRSCMSSLDFKPCLDDPRSCIGLVNKSDANECYECALIYSDTSLLVSDNTESMLRN